MEQVSPIQIIFAILPFVGFIVALAVFVGYVIYIDIKEPPMKTSK